MAAAANGCQPVRKSTRAQKDKQPQDLVGKSKADPARPTEALAGDRALCLLHRHRVEYNTLDYSANQLLGRDTAWPY